MIHAFLLAAAIPAEAAEHENPFSPASPEFWVYAGITIFLLFALFGLKAPKLIATALDKRIAETRRQLDEARAIRAEAEALLAAAKARQESAHHDAANLLVQARQEAEEMVREMKEAATDLIARREKMAADKIAVAERTAVTEVRARVATAATAAAATLIAQSHSAKADKELVDETIARLAH